MAYTIEPPIGSTETAPPRPKYTISPPAEQKPEPGLLDRMWQGMVGGDVSKAGRFGMGVADPVFGAAQIGARMEQTPGGGVPEQAAGYDAPPNRTSEIDTLTQQREQRYTQRREQAGQVGQRPTYDPNSVGSDAISPGPGKPQTGLDADWARMLGTATATAPLAAIGGALAPASAAGRMAVAAGIGAASGATEPVASGDFATEKAKQIGMGAAGGAVGGALGEAAGSTIGRAIASNSPEMVNEHLLNKFRQVMKPGIRGRLSAPKLDSQDTQILSVMDGILENKANLKLSDPSVPDKIVTGQAPSTIRQFSEAIEQGKAATFQKYDALAQSADLAESATPNRHLSQFTDASRKAAILERDVAKADQAMTMATAQQQRAGNNVYMSATANKARQEAQKQLQKAQTALDKAREAKAAARTKAYSLRVDLGDAAKQLRAAAGDGFITDLHPDVATKLNRLARRLDNEQTMTPSETQQLIQDINQELKGYYQTGQGAVGDKIAPVARDLRKKLDDTITGATGKQYQVLKDRYGAYAAVEQDVARAFHREANKISGGLAGRFFNTLSAAEMVSGIFDPSHLVRAAGFKGAQEIMRKLNDPNRAVQQMFKLREQTKNIGKQTLMRDRIGGAMAPSVTPFGGEVGSAAMGMSMRQPQRRDNQHTVEPPPAP